MRKIILFVTAIILSTSIFAGENVNLVFKNTKNQLEVNSIDQEGFAFTVTVAEAFVKEVKNENGLFSILQMPGYTKSGNYGTPDLPSRGKLIEVPFGANVEISIISAEEQIIDLGSKGVNSVIMPCQPSLAKCDDPNKESFTMNKEVYETNAFFANEIISYNEVGIMRGTRLGRIEINPFEYNPVTNQLKVYTDIEVEVEFKNADAAKTNEMHKVYGNSMYNNLLQSTLNHQNGAKPLNERQPLKMVIISDRMFEENLAPFIQWKQETGIEVIVRYTDEGDVGSTTTSIKSYLQGLYESATETNPAPTFALLVGDKQQIPAFNGEAGGHITDLYYYTYDGANDLIPDINYGRFSAQTTAQLDIIIEKTLLYEKYEMADPSYLTDAVLVAGVDGGYATVYGNGAINYIHDFYMNEDNGVNAHVYLYPESGSSGSQIIQNISDGVAWGNYTAHCSPSGWADPSFTTSDIPGLQNDEKYGLLIGNCCLSNKFDESECFGEALLRTADKGAIGYIGGTNSTYWDEDYYWATGYGTPVQYPNYEDFGNGSYDLYYHQNLTDQPVADWAPTQSQVNLAGQLAVEEGGTRTQYYWEIYTLMGDPSLIPLVGVPEDINPNYLSTIPIGLNSLDVSGVPAYAVVALSNNGELLASVVADESGSATLDFDAFTTPATAKVVITAQFHKPFIGELSVIPSNEPFVVISDYTINDGNGNNNGLLDFGETVSLDVVMSNVGTIDASSVEVTLLSDNQYVTISDNEETLGDISGESQVTLENAFAFNVASNVPDGEAIQFSVKADDGTNDPWITNITISANAPMIELSQMSYSDVGGNNNGRLDAGEVIEISLNIDNVGHAAGEDVLASLTAASDIVEVVDGNYTIETIDGQASQVAKLYFAVSSEAESGDVASVDITITYGDQVITESLSRSVGLMMEDFETGTFTSFGWSNADQWEITTDNVYAGTYSAMSSNIDDEQSAALSITIEVTADDAISFMRKVSSESGYDYLRFYIDNVQKGEWSGEEDWTEESYPVTAGTHTFKWEYEKDYSVSDGSDCGWIDNVVFPGFAGGGSTDNNLPVLTISGDNMAYSNHSFEINATANDEDGDALVYACANMPEWMTLTDNGDGTASINADAAPASAEGQVFTMAVVVGDGTAFVHETTTITVQKFPDGINEMEDASKLAIYPNPANTVAHFAYTLTNNAHVRASIYNVTGQLVKHVVDQNQVSGEYHYNVDVTDMDNGIYFFNIQIGNDHGIQKMIISK